MIVFPLMTIAISRQGTNQAVRFPTSVLAGKRAFYFDAAIHVSIFVSSTVSGSAPVFRT
jgi:hypothetical protein